MAISKARQRFRRYLIILLIFSLSFFTLVSYYYVSVKQKRIHITELSPTLFEIDVYQHKARSYFSTYDTQYKIGIELIQKSAFDFIYFEAGVIIIKDLAEKGHPPSQSLYADLLMIDNKTELAMHYYKLAADQFYLPAREILEDIKIASELNNTSPQK